MNKKLEMMNPWQPQESLPSQTPRWASSRTASTPAAGMRGSQPGPKQDCKNPTPEMNASVSEKFKIKNYIEQARLDPPVLGREGGQHGQQHRHPSGQRPPQRSYVVNDGNGLLVPNL